jgi:hypothetical protein
MSRVWLVLAITLAASRALAHVAPSVDDNNRYLKVTPGADRVRLAYTVFFGEVPGAQMRKTVDADHDGAISDAEAQAFGAKLAAEVASSLELSLDGHPVPVAWTTVSVGTGSPQTAAGAFSVDLVTWPCLATAFGKHTLALRDHFRIPRPGETELKVEEAPGISIEHARVGGVDDPGYDYRFAGPGGPLSDEGLDLAYTASDKAPRMADGSCAAATPVGKKRIPIVVLIGAAAVLGFLLAGIVVLVQRRQRRG